MTAEPLRVALLARTGLACDRLRAAIDQAGAQCVLQADPTALEPSALVEVAPKVVLVALDPQAEDALERFDEVLFDPVIEVIYEEAALAATREGWDVARWQRHLVAKLQQHGDVLPPGGEPEDADAEEVDRTDAITFGAFDADPRFSDGDGDDALSRASSTTPYAPPAGEGLPASEDPASEEPAFAPETMLETTRLETAPALFHPFDPVFAEAVDDAPMVDVPLDQAPLMTLEVEFEAVELDIDTASKALSSDIGNAWSVEAGDTDGDIGFDGDTDPGPGHHDDAAAHGGMPAPESPATSASRGFFGELSLDDGSAPAATQDNDEAKNRFQRDISDLEVRISGLTLVDDTPVQGPEQARGAVLVLAGLGGPDAVRQLLGALPEGFSRPVLVQQRLDGGRYDKLVAQMQRATTLPVRLAEPGEFAHAGIVYILPASVGVDVSDTGAGIRFNHGGELLAALPSSDSAVLLLSGSDAGQVDATLNHGWAGALVAGQVADGCYDAVASNALAARGGDTGTPVELAQRLAERWPS